MHIFWAIVCARSVKTVFRRGHPTAQPALVVDLAFPCFPESHGNGEHGQLGSNDQSDVQRLRARLLALQGLVETYLITESAQGRGFDPARLRSFLSPQHLSTGLDATVESTGETEWEDSDYRRIFLQTTAMEFAVEGQASALEVLFERYPGEVLPVRLETLRWVDLSAAQRTPVSIPFRDTVLSMLSRTVSSDFADYYSFRS